MKIASLALIALSFVFCACHKEKTCSCTVTRSGTTTTINATDGFPPVIAASSDTTQEPYTWITHTKTTYEPGFMKSIKRLCPSKTDEEVYDKSTTSAAGLYSLTTIDDGHKVTECNIE